MPAPVTRPLSGALYSAVELSDDERSAWVLDQRRLPGEETYLEVRSAHEMADAIASMVVRGAPAIGIAAAYGLALTEGSQEPFLGAADRLRRARPTAVNLAWAVDRMLEAREGGLGLVEAARAIHREDVAACRAIGAHGAALLPEGCTVLTHCNAGALATGGYGTALGVVRAAHAMGRIRGVIADETRPYLQGARLTAWELQKDGIPVTLATDGMAAHLMKRGLVDAVVVGADRVAKNGDVANKIGTYGLAILARHHGLPFYVAAPRSTLDPWTEDGACIPIEERSSDEVVVVGGARVAPEGVTAHHPAFDVTPAGLVTAVVCEDGVVSFPLC